MMSLRPPNGSVRHRSPKRPSPILVPVRPERTVTRRLGNWIRRFLGAPPPAVQTQVLETPAPKPEPPPTPSSVPVSPMGMDAQHHATVQMLPGRLEPLLPEVIQQEVRFQRAAGAEQEVTLGWELGDPPHHVTLEHPSIQALHAKMTFQKGNWMIESLATNDPVEINGTPVPSSAGPYLLASGDQVRIGEALFRFHLP